MVGILINCEHAIVASIARGNAILLFAANGLTSRDYFDNVVSNLVERMVWGLPTQFVTPLSPSLKLLLLQQQNQLWTLARNGAKPHYGLFVYVLV